MGKKSKFPFVSICTPTFNRRPFIPMAIKCFEHQTYPKDRMEWIIVDDGDDKIEDLVSHIPQVRYVKYDEKMTLGKKRNITNDMAKGDIIVYMDDDDYYPPERVKHAVDTLKGSKALCAGSSAMFIYFKHIDKMLQFGPYGPNHATAATFAFKRELLKQTRFDESSSVAEERKFLKDYKIPFVQLESNKTILVFSHDHNSFDKKELLKQMPNPNIHETPLTPKDFVKEEDILHFFMEEVNDLLKQMPNPNIHETPLTPKDFVKEEDILHFFMEEVNDLLKQYEPGNPENKQDVKKQLSDLKVEREKQMQDHIKKQMEYKDTLSKLNVIMNKKDRSESDIVQQLTNENTQLREQVEYLNGKIKQLIAMQIEQKKNVSL